MSSIIKTGVILRKVNEPRYAYLFQQTLPQDQFSQITTVYGDLHVVGNCCILYYPEVQVMWGTSHGWIDLYDPYGMHFQRDTSPDRILVLPAYQVRMRRGSMHPTDLEKFKLAGGIVDEAPGEMG